MCPTTCRRRYRSQRLLGTLKCAKCDARLEGNCCQQLLELFFVIVARIIAPSVVIAVWWWHRCFAVVVAVAISITACAAINRQQHVKSIVCTQIAKSCSTTGAAHTNELVHVCVCVHVSMRHDAWTRRCVAVWRVVRRVPRRLGSLQMSAIASVVKQLLLYAATASNATSWRFTLAISAISAPNERLQLSECQWVEWHRVERHWVEFPCVEWVSANQLFVCSTERALSLSACLLFGARSGRAVLCGNTIYATHVAPPHSTPSWVSARASQQYRNRDTHICAIVRIYGICVWVLCLCWCFAVLWILLDAIWANFVLAVLFMPSSQTSRTARSVRSATQSSVSSSL